MILNTKNNYAYYFNFANKGWLLLNSLLVEVFNNPTKIESIIEHNKKVQFNDSNNSFENLEYYLKKYNFLLKSGFLNNTNELAEFNKLLTAQEVKYNLANTPQVVFEVTENCNLSCKYCGYGEFYSRSLGRGKSSLDIEDAKALLEYLQPMWNSELNDSSGKDITIGFYGGEPLLNFTFIKGIVDFCNNLFLRDNHFKFNITTNGTLLKKHINFLVEHNFNVLISLDGSESNNAYRLSKSNINPFNIIYNNSKYIQNKFPDFFKYNVNFNAVLHRKNTVKEIYTFFKTEFQKIPFILPLNNSGILPEKINEFEKTYLNYSDSLANEENYQEIENDMFDKSSNIQDLSLFIHSKVGFNFHNYNGIFRNEIKTRDFPTGTCLPFSKKIYLTSNKQILSCERIDYGFSLGSINKKVVNLDFNEIARKYNEFYRKLSYLCNRCYIQNACMQCFYYIPLIKEENFICHGFTNKEQFKKYIEKMLNEVEINRSIYLRIIKEIHLTN